jgi:hypothetical protein
MYLEDTIIFGGGPVVIPFCAHVLLIQAGLLVVIS